MKTILFGAGASIPFFAGKLTTDSLTKAVQNINNWDYVVKKYKEKSLSNFKEININEVLVIINKILAINKNVNFEQIAEIIDKIGSYKFDNVPMDNSMNLLIRVLFCNSIDFQLANIHNYWRIVPFLYREIIANKILEIEENKDKNIYDELIKKQYEFIKYVCDEDSKVSLVSLNYDDSVLDSINDLDIKLCFDESSKVNGNDKILDVKKFMKGDKIIYFPHGHLRFYYTDQENVIFYKSAKDAREQRFKHIDGFRTGDTFTIQTGKFAYSYNTFIFTGQTKDDGLNFLPYAIYYQRLAIDLFNSDEIYIIGYSFGDDHINRLLYSFLKIDESHKVYIIDKFNGDICDVANYTKEDCILSKIYNVILNKELMIDKNDRVYQKKEHYINDQIIFYQKGYDEFLKEYECVLKL